MELVHLVIDGFPHLDEQEYLGQLEMYIKNGWALILKNRDTAVGIMALQEQTGSIDFFGVHPQYRNCGITKAFCHKSKLITGQTIFRADSALVSTNRATKTVSTKV